MRHNSRIVYWIVFPNLNVSLERPKELENAEIEGERVNSLNWQGILRTDRPCLACQPSSQFWVRPRRSSASSAGPIFARWPLIMRMESENLFPLTSRPLPSFFHARWPSERWVPLERIQRGSSILTIGLLATLPSAKIHQLMQRLCSRDPKLGLTWHLNLNWVDPLWTLSVTMSLPGMGSKMLWTHRRTRIANCATLATQKWLASLTFLQTTDRDRLRPLKQCVCLGQGFTHHVHVPSAFGGCEWMWGRFLHKQFASCIVVGLNMTM